MEIMLASMEPTLTIGDAVVVRRVVNPCEIQVGLDGDIIAFYRPVQGDIIIYRAIDKILIDETWYFKTKGDKNVAPDPWLVSYYLAKDINTFRYHRYLVS